MIVPFNKLQIVHEELKPSLLSALENVISTSAFIHGNDLRQFEQTYAAYSGVMHCIGVGNGFDALKVALKVLGIGMGDKVVVPAHTFSATWMAVTEVGATPVGCDVDAATYNINVEELIKLDDPTIKAVIPVHIYGLPCLMDEILQIAELKKWFVIEDNAQAQGATYGGKPTGSFGVINATSFYPGKNLGALGDGGAITTNNQSLANKAAQFGNYGSLVKYEHDSLGVNSRLDTLQAAFLSIKLKHLSAWNEQRRKIVQRYKTQLQGVDNIQWQHTPDECTHVYHLATILTSKRDELQIYLQTKGIQTIIHYPIAPHLQKAFKPLGYKHGDFPIAENTAATTLSLPLFIGMTDDEIDYVAEQVRNFFKL
jgi:dTDP-4-amino-4,6-dideoxygalactose transaminase